MIEGGWGGGARMIERGSRSSVEIKLSKRVVFSHQRDHPRLPYTLGTCMPDDVRALILNDKGKGIPLGTESWDFDGRGKGNVANSRVIPTMSPCNS